MTENQLLTVKQIAEYLGVKSSTIYKWNSQGRIPCIRLSGRCVRYELDKVKKWLNAIEDKGRTTRRIKVDDNWMARGRNK
jgi:excisionase family DNA binding protein